MKKNDVDKYIANLKQKLNWKGKHFPKTEAEQIADQKVLMESAKGEKEREQVKLFIFAANNLKTYSDLKISDYIMKKYSEKYNNLFEEDEDNNEEEIENHSAIPTLNDKRTSESSSSVPFNTKSSDSITRIFNSNSVIQDNSSSASSISIGNQRTTTDLINTVVMPNDNMGNGKKTLQNKKVDVPTPKTKSYEEKENMMLPKKNVLSKNVTLEKQEPKAKVKVTNKQVTDPMPEKEEKLKEMTYRIFDNHSHAKTLPESKIINLAQKYDEKITTIHAAIDELEKHGLMVW